MSQQETMSEWDRQGGSWKLRAYSPCRMGVSVTPDSVGLSQKQPEYSQHSWRLLATCLNISEQQWES